VIFTRSLYANHDMDSRTIVISHGQSSMFSRKGEGRASREQTTPKPHQMVDVYIKDTFVRAMPVLLIVRFSKYAARTFPKPVNQEQSTAEVAQRSPTTPKAADDPIIVNGSGPDMANSPDAAPTNVQSPQSDSCTSKPPHKELILDLTGAAKSPSLDAILNCLRWMLNNNHVRSGQRLLDFHIPEPSHASLPTLVDIYAAVLCFDLRPFPGNLRRTIMDRLSTRRPLAYEIEYIHEHLPAEDSIVTRAITAYFEHLEADRYSDLENAAIHQYVDTHIELYNRFAEIENARWERMQGQRRVRAERRRPQVPEGMDAIITDAEGLDQPKPTGGRRRNRRKQQSDGKARAAADAQGGAQVTNEYKIELDEGASSSRGKKPTSGNLKEGNGRGTGGRHVPGAD